MDEEGHRAFVASWTDDGLSCDEVGEGVPDRAARRAWCCSCGWRGVVRDVNGRFFRPSGDVAGRLRASRVRRSDRAAEHAWRGHLEADATGPVPDPKGGAGSDARRTPENEDLDAADTPDAGYKADAAESSDGSAGARVVSLHAPRGISERALRAQRRAAVVSDGSVRSAPAAASAEGRVPSAGVDGRLGGGVAAPSSVPASAAAVESPSALDPVAAAAAEREHAHAAFVAAEAALREAVQEARDAGLSWRAIAASAGVDHRSARERWAGQ